jgi:hypothetical protein
VLTAADLHPAMRDLEQDDLDGVPLQGRMLLRTSIDFPTICAIMDEGRLCRSDDVAQAYDVILGRW